MPTFTEDGERTFVSYITGPSHVRLGLRFGDAPVATPALVRQPPMGSCSHGEIDELSLIEAVRAGVVAVSPELHVVEIFYVADDSPRYSLFSQCAKLLAERFKSGPA